MSSSVTSSSCKQIKMERDQIIAKDTIASAYNNVVMPKAKLFSTSHSNQIWILSKLV